MNIKTHYPKIHKKCGTEMITIVLANELGNITYCPKCVFKKELSKTYKKAIEDEIKKIRCIACEEFEEKYNEKMSELIRKIRKNIENIKK